jgi:sec-independent protein translocase protein TatB
MPDISFGEILIIAVLALLVFGPDRLPKVAADAGRTIRQLRAMVTAARKDLSDAAGLDSDGELGATLRDLDPRTILRGEAPRSAPQSGAEPAGGRRPAADGGPGADGGSAAKPSGPPTKPSAGSESSMQDWT